MGSGITHASLYRRVFEICIIMANERRLTKCIHSRFISLHFCGRIGYAILVVILCVLRTTGMAEEVVPMAWAWFLAGPMLCTSPEVLRCWDPTSLWFRRWRVSLRQPLLLVCRPSIALYVHVWMFFCRRYLEIWRSSCGCPLSSSLDLLLVSSNTVVSKDTHIICKSVT